MKEKPNTSLPHYIIGTRGSLLALTQCLQVKDQLEAMGEATFSLKIIKTEGDENTSAPLWAIDGKDFFTKELDQALLGNEVDMVVHSYKDLGSERPQGIKLATITKRSFANDILFIRKSALNELQEKSKNHFVVGTSSPRRMTNIETALQEYLPWGAEKEIKVTTKSLRGNVNTRLKKCVDGEYDAVVLALPGIERLALGLKNEENEAYEKHGNPIAILKELIKELDFMVLPLSTFPAAASQGALGIECLEKRDDQGHLEGLLKKLNDERTISEVKRERELFQKFGGGCHLAVGISVSSTPAGLRQCLRGKVDEKAINEISMVRESELPPLKGTRFIGLPKVSSFQNALADELLTKEALSSFKEELLKFEGQDLLATSPSVVQILKENLNPDEIATLANKNSWWASGAKTMRKLAEIGIWVKGSADSLGEDHLKEIRSSALIDLFLGKARWTSLTGEGNHCTLGPTLSLYKKVTKGPSPDFRKTIEECGLYYWTSPSQYDAYQKEFNLNPDAFHACGLGKTYSALKEEKELHAISSMQELKTWSES